MMLASTILDIDDHLIKVIDLWLVHYILNVVVALGILLAINLLWERQASISTLKVFTMFKFIALISWAQKTALSECTSKVQFLFGISLLGLLSLLLIS
jgi:hypothetical protein